MDIIERVFHIFPDGGSGLSEWTLLFLAVSLVAALLLSRRAGQRRER